MDDVDEYLERVAVEAEALQEQVRLATERMRAGGRTGYQRRAAVGAGSPANRAQQAQYAQTTQQGDVSTEHIEVADDALQRTLSSPRSSSINAVRSRGGAGTSSSRSPRCEPAISSRMLKSTGGS